MKHKTLVTAVLLFLSVPAYAGSINLLIGHNDAGFRDRCNLRQTGSPLPQKIDIKSTAWAIEYTGTTPVSYLDFTFGAEYNGRNSASGLYVSDPNCEAYIWHGVDQFKVKWETKSYGLTASLDPTYRQGDWSVFSRFGLYQFWDEVSVNDGSYLDETFKARTWLVAVGYTYKYFIVKYATTGRAHSTNSPANENNIFSIGVRIPI